jgi:hypothetical protein
MKKQCVVTLSMLALFLGFVTTGVAARKPRAAVPLTFTVADGTGYNIRPDAAGPSYANGQSGLSANFASDGNLVIDFGSRSLHFDYDEPLGGVTGVDPTPQPPPPDLSAWNNEPLGCYLATLPTTGGVAIQEMAIPSSQCVQLSIAFDLSGTTYRNVFQRGSYLAGTAFGVITRNSSTEWALEPGACGTDVDTAAARLNEVVTIRGK